MPVPRVLESRLTEAAAEMPVVAVTGPRQSGKTTLCRMVFPAHEYVTLEPLDMREFALEDPRGFLAQHPGPAVLDEVQRAPELFSYLQEAVDRDASPGRYVLTGSQHLGLSEALSQSLAGRVALLHLLPMSVDELEGFGGGMDDLWATVWAGGYPRIHDRELSPARWLADYVATYVQRDVRQLLQVRDLDAFTRVLRLAAGRTAQEERLSALAADAGISHPTVRSWLSVLETSFIIHRLPPWLRNLRKRVVKSPKLHFLDSGLACHLLGIREPDQLRTHPLRGPIFESWVVAEVLKARVHRGHAGDLHHFRENRGVEVDLVVETADRLIATEVKSGATLASDSLTGLKKLRDRIEESALGTETDLRLVFGGDRGQRRTGVDAIPWRQVQDRPWS